MRTAWLGIVGVGLIACGGSGARDTSGGTEGATTGNSTGSAGSSAGGAGTGGTSGTVGATEGSSAGGETDGGSGTGTGTGTGTDTGTTGGIVPIDCIVEDVLFVGNSYTSANDLPGLVTALGEAAGCRPAFASHTVGGARFLDHAQNDAALDLIRSRDWDAVVLQNQSQVPGWWPDDVKQYSLPYAEMLAAVAREDGKNPRIVYYQTWGRKDGDAANCEYHPLVCTFDGHTQALMEGYQIYSDATQGEVASVGQTWKAVRDDPGAPFDAAGLWAADGSHPSLQGSYLTAAVLFARLFDASPEGSSATAGLAPDVAAYLQAMAAAAP